MMIRQEICERSHCLTMILNVNFFMEQGLAFVFDEKRG